MHTPSRVLPPTIIILAALSLACQDGPHPKAQPSATPATTAAATFEVEVYGLFALVMPEKPADQDGKFRYDPLHVLTPRAINPAVDADIPSTEQAHFTTDWLPVHRTVIQIPAKHLAPPTTPEASGTLSLFLDLPSLFLALPAPGAIAPLVEFPCDGGPKPVVIDKSELDLIPVVLRASDATASAALDPQTITNQASSKRVAMRLVFRCGEDIAVSPRKDADGQEFKVTPAYLKKSSGGAWRDEWVTPVKPAKRGGDLTFTRSISGPAQLRLNGSTLSLYPDAQGKLKVTVRSVTEEEILTGKVTTPNARTSLEHFRLLYALAIPKDKEKREYHYYALHLPEAGSPFCDAYGRFVK